MHDFISARYNKLILRKVWGTVHLKTEKLSNKKMKEIQRAI